MLRLAGTKKCREKCGIKAIGGKETNRNLKAQNSGMVHLACVSSRWSPIFTNQLVESGTNRELAGVNSQNKLACWDCTLQN